jgi:hypothetical protein
MRHQLVVTINHLQYCVSGDRRVLLAHLIALRSILDTLNEEDTKRVVNAPPTLLLFVQVQQTLNEIEKSLGNYNDYNWNQKRLEDIEINLREVVEQLQSRLNLEHSRAEKTLSCSSTRDRMMHGVIPLSSLMNAHRLSIDQYAHICISRLSRLRVSGLEEHVDNILSLFFNVLWDTLPKANQEELRKELQRLSIPMPTLNRRLRHDNIKSFERQQAGRILENKRSDNLDEHELYHLIAQNSYLPSMVERDSSPLMNDEYLLKSIGQILREERCAVVLGDPGSGKTTFACWLGLFCAQALVEEQMCLIDPLDRSDCGPVRLPILIRAGEIASMLEEHPTYSLVDCLSTWCSETFDVSSDLIVDFIYSGHALIIIDGLDEVPRADRRSHVFFLIRDFIRKFVFISPPTISPGVVTDLLSIEELQQSSETIGNQLFITSRIVGYHAQPLADDFVGHYMLTPLSDDAMNDFIDYWYSSIYNELKPIVFSSFNHQSSKSDQNHLKERSHALKQLLSDHANMRSIASNPLLLSAICALAVYTTSINSLPTKRIQLYHATSEAMFNAWIARSAIVSKEVLCVLLADTALHIHQHSLSGLIEEFDMRALCRTSLQRHWPIHQPHDSRYLVSEFVRLVSQDVGLFVPRGVCVYGFLHLTFQEYFASLHLIQSNGNEDCIETISKRFLHYITDFRFREPLLLGLGWLSWHWSTEQLDCFCACLLADDENILNSRFPLGAMLLISALPDLVRLPKKDLIFDAFDRFMKVSVTFRWLVYFPVFIEHFLGGLANLPPILAAEWLSGYLLTAPIVSVFEIARILMKVLVSKKIAPSWLDSNVCTSFQHRLPEEETSETCTINRLLTAISMLSSHLIVSPAREFLAAGCADRFRHKRIHPQLLAIIIGLYGGLERYQETDITHVNFSLSHMHRSFVPPFLSSELIRCALEELPIEHLRQFCQTTITQWIDHANERLSEAVDLIIVWLCVYGFDFQPCLLIDNTYWRSIYPLALGRFRRIIVYLRDLYFAKYDEDRSCEKPAAFRNHLTQIMEYSISRLRSNEGGERRIDVLTTQFAPFVESTAISFARLTTSRNPLLSDKCQFSKRVLKLKIPNVLPSVDFWTIDIMRFGCKMEDITSPFMLANMKKETQNELKQILIGTHPMFLIKRQPLLLLAFLPKTIQLLQEHILTTSKKNTVEYRMTVLCVLVEILCLVSKGMSFSLNVVRCALLLFIMRSHCEEYNLFNFYVAIIYLARSKLQIGRYFSKFEQQLSTTGTRPIPNQEELRVQLINALTAERERGEAVRLNMIDRDENALQLYISAVSSSALSAALEQQNLGLSTALHINNPVLKVHALSVIYKFTQCREQNELAHGEIVRSLAEAAQTQYPLENFALFTFYALGMNLEQVRYKFKWYRGQSNDESTMLRLIERLKNENDTRESSDACKQAVCEALLSLNIKDTHNRVFVRLRELLCASNWFKSENRMKMLRIGSLPFRSFFDKLDFRTLLPGGSEQSVLLASMYLMEICIDAHVLSDWLCQPPLSESISKMPAKLFRPHSEELSLKEACAINQFLTDARERVIDENVHRFEQNLREYRSVTESAYAIVESWLEYKDHPHLHVFACHAALLCIDCARARHPIAVLLCCSLITSEIDHFRRQAIHCLELCSMRSSVLGMQGLLSVANIHLTVSSSACLNEAITKLTIKIDSVEHMDALLTWERERLYYLYTKFTDQTPSSFVVLSHQLILQKPNDLHVSLLRIDKGEHSTEVHNRFIDELYRAIRTSETGTSEYMYARELVHHLSRRQFTIRTTTSIDGTLLKELAHLIYLCPSSPLCHTILETLGCFEWAKLGGLLLEEVLRSKDSLPDDIMITAIRSYCRTDGRRAPDDIIALLKNLMANASSRLALEASAGLVSLEGDDLRMPYDSEFIDDTFGGEESISYYRALMVCANDISDNERARLQLILLISSRVSTLLEPFAQDLTNNLEKFDEYENDLSIETHFNVADSIMNSMPASLQVAIGHSALGEQRFKQVLYHVSKLTNRWRRIAALRLLSSYGELTDHLAEMYLSAAWETDKRQQERAYTSIARIQRVSSRDVVEHLFKQLNNVSLQQRYMAASLLVQLARVNEVSTSEVQMHLAKALTDDSDRIFVGSSFGRHLDRVNWRLENRDDSVMQALGNLLMQLSFMPTLPNAEDWLLADEVDLDFELSSAIDAAMYVSCSLTFGEHKKHQTVKPVRKRRHKR